MSGITKPSNVNAVVAGQSRALPPPGRLSVPIAARGLDPGMAYDRLARLRAGADGTPIGPLNLEPPDTSLLRIYQASRGRLFPEISPLFPPYRDLGELGQKWLRRLWKEHNRQNDTIVMGDYAGDPLGFYRETASWIEMPPGIVERVIFCLHQILQSLVSEQVWEGIRYRLVEDGVAVLPGAVPLEIGSIDRQIARFAEAIAPLQLEGCPAIREGLARLQLASHPLGRKRFSSGQGREMNTFLVRRVCPDLDLIQQARVAFLHALRCCEEKGRSGDSLFTSLPERAGFKEFVHALGQGLQLPDVIIVRALSGRDEPYLHLTEGVPLSTLPEILSLLNLVRVHDPVPILLPLYRDYLQWAFVVSVRRDGRVEFGMRSRPEPDLLKKGGLGPVLTAARGLRGWSVRSVGERVTRQIRTIESGKPDRIVSPDLIAHLGSNRSRLRDLSLMKAIVAAFNEHRKVEPVDPAVVFLGAEPTWIDLLPLSDAKTGRPLRRPAAPPFTIVDYPSPKGGTPACVSPRAAAEGGLDHRGFPYLIKHRRLALGWRVEEAGARLGVESGRLTALEIDPPKGKRDGEVPGRVLIGVAADPRGYNLPLARVLRAVWYTYWSDDPEIEKVRRRSFGTTSFFVDGYSSRSLRQYARFDFPTPAEFLYLWRNSPAPYQKGNGSFPLSRREMAKLVGITPIRYRHFERNAAILSDGEIDKICARLRRAPADRRRLREANRELEKILLSRAAPLPRAPWLDDFPGIRNLLSLSRVRPFFTPQSVRNLFRRLEFLRRVDPASLPLLDREGRKMTHPSSEELGDLIGTINRAYKKLVHWPSRVARRGPTIALFHFNPAPSRAIDRLEAILRNPRVTAIDFNPRSGSFQVTRTPPPGPYDPTRVLLRDRQVAALIQEPGRLLIHEFFVSLRERKLVKDKASQRVIAGWIRTLAQRNPASLPFFLTLLRRTRSSGGGWEGTESRRIRRALHWASHFARQWGEEVAIEGSLVEFAYRNRGRTAFFNRINHRIASGTVQKVIFRGARCEFVTRESRRWEGRRGTSYSYRKARALFFLPRPSNNWGAADLALSREELCARLGKIFDRVEAFLRKEGIRSAAEIQRAFGMSDYYSYRGGRAAIPSFLLSDESLDRFGLRTVRDKEEMRHLQALLLVRQNLEHQPRRGPHRDKGLLILYFRLLHRISSIEVGRQVTGLNYSSRYPLLELGHEEPYDRRLLLRIARANGVPEVYERHFADHLMH